MKGLYHKDLSYKTSEYAYKTMFLECADVEWIKKAFNLAWTDYVNNKFHYDGATFVRENNNEFWEVASFIHDWLNVIGYVGKDVDIYFIDIMIELEYPTNIIFERSKWMQWTFLNVLIHKVRGNYISKEIPKYLK